MEINDKGFDWVMWAPRITWSVTAVCAVGTVGLWMWIALTG